MSRTIHFFLFLVCLSGCSKKSPSYKKHQEAGYIERLHREFRFAPLPAQKKPLPVYPWETRGESAHPRITKDYFRCNGSALNPPRHEGAQRLEDCGGFHSHSLSIKEEKEFIYPVLIDLLNYLQEVTGHKVVITCGHRCLKHHLYARIRGQSRASKHMMGAEVAFYVAGMENQPEKIVELIQNYYAEDDDDYRIFTRYTKDDVDVSTLPWLNKEIYMKIYQADEGRDFDNRHPYPYIRIQVRFDRKHNQRVLFRWDIAEKNILFY